MLVRVLDSRPGLACFNDALSSSLVTLLSPQSQETECRVQTGAETQPEGSPPA